MLDHFFGANSPALSAKMVGEVVLSSREHSVGRAKRYFDFIANKLGRDSRDTIIIPFIDNFSQVVSTLHRNYALLSSLASP